MMSEYQAYKGEVFGPYNSLKKAYKTGKNLNAAVRDYLHSVDKDYYGHNQRPKFTDDMDLVIKLFISRTWPEHICDELGITYNQLEARAQQLGMATNGFEYDYEQINIARNMHNAGCSVEDICRVLKLPMPQPMARASREDKLQMKQDADEAIRAQQAKNKTQANLFGGDDK